MGKQIEGREGKSYKGVNRQVRLYQVQNINSKEKKA